MLKAKGEICFFNRTYNLIYGKCLKKYADMVEIIYYKMQSNTYKVNYKKPINELWGLKLDEDEEKDKLKKMIACINIGSLEKQTNTAKRGPVVFSKMLDAFY